MAYIQPQNDPNAPALAGAMGAPGAMNQPPTTSAGGTATTSSAPGSPQGATTVPNATQAPPVQDLKAYLEANAPQAVQMGQKIAGDLNTTAGKVTGDINAAQQDVAAQVQAQNIAPNQDLVERAAENPAEFVKNQQDMKDFLAQENASYGGPTTFESTTQAQPLATEVANAQQQAPDITKPQGVEQLARGQEVNPTTGMSNLDSLLLQESPGALEPVAKALPQFGTLGTQLTGASAATNAAIQKAIANTQAAKAGVNSRFLTGDKAVVPTWESGVTKELTDAQKNANDYNDAVNKIIQEQNGMVPLVNSTKSAMQALQDADKAMGLTPDAINKLRTDTGAKPLPDLNTDWASLLKAPTPLTTAPTLGTVATPQDYAIEQALQELLGGNLGTVPLDLGQSGEAGTFKVPTTPTLPISQVEADLAPWLAASKPAPGMIASPGAPAGSIGDVVGKGIAANKAEQDLLNYLQGLK